MSRVIPLSMLQLLHPDVFFLVFIYVDFGHLGAGCATLWRVVLSRDARGTVGGFFAYDCRVVCVCVCVLVCVRERVQSTSKSNFTIGAYEAVISVLCT